LGEEPAYGNLHRDAESCNFEWLSFELSFSRQRALNFLHKISDAVLQNPLDFNRPFAVSTQRPN